MCKFRNDIDTVLNGNKTAMGKAIKLLANMLDNRFSEQDKKIEELKHMIESEHKSLETVGFLANHRWILILFIAGIIFLCANGILDTIKLFMK